MSDVSTRELHDRADKSAASGDFVGALRACAEAVRLSNDDHRARLKVGLCLAGLGKTEESLHVLALGAEMLARRGFALAAIGVCRDALGIAPDAQEILIALARIHARIHGLEARGRTRLLPPIPPLWSREGDSESLLGVASAQHVIERAIAIAASDPDRAPTLVEPQHVALFSDLSEGPFSSLIGSMEYRKLPGGSTIFRQDEAGSSLFIVVDGEVLIERERDGASTLLARLGPGALFGEMALINANARTATVTTARPTELFEIGREHVERVAVGCPSIASDLARFARRRLLSNLLATSKIFQPFGVPEKQAILRSFEPRVIDAGTVIIDEGKTSQGLFLVLDGEVEVSKIDAGGDKVVLAYLREGEVFGEISLIENRATMAVVIATQKTVLLFLERERFSAIAKDHPKVLEYLSQLSGERREVTERAMSDGVVLEADDLILV